MSLHAQLSPEARDALARQRRNTKATSFIIAILGTTLLALLLGFFGFQMIQPRVHEFEPYVMIAPPDDPPVEVPTVTRFSQPTAPSSMAAPIIVAHMMSPDSIPTVEVQAVDGTGFGDEGDFRLGNGDDFGPGPGEPSLIRGNIGKRCSKQERLVLLQESGASAATDNQVIRALQFMKGTQAADGGWGTKNRAAMTGLSLLAYLGHCETPQSEEFGESCLKAIMFLTDRGMAKKGRLADSSVERHWPYEQAIATYALAEAETMCRGLGMNIPHLREVVQQAGQLIIDSQHPSGGWDYAYDEVGKRGGDLSITGWHVQALKACKLSGIDFRNLKRCADKALDYVGERQADDGGFGYTGTSSAGGTPNQKSNGCRDALISNVGTGLEKCGAPWGEVCPGADAARMEWPELRSLRALLPRAGDVPAGWERVEPIPAGLPSGDQRESVCRWLMAGPRWWRQSRGGGGTFHRQDAGWSALSDGFGDVDARGLLPVSACFKVMFEK